VLERDSRKDQLIVVLFLIVTSGLLVYALIRPYVQSWLAVFSPFPFNIVNEQRAPSQRQTRIAAQAEEYETLPT